MKKAKDFDFARARRVTPEETLAFKKAIENTFQIKRPARGRPPKGDSKYRDVHIRLHPLALAWAHTEARHRGIGYQTFINEVLLNRAQAAQHK
ncbi:MAG: AT hook motif protein [Elusimicrobia bacterium GWA2_62_23]|nr:MAG: AT hook motif protein [Elusimicrobia bacterium GWA2_62_23]OGR71452.1 MAG: AT hook motif protein [Elusimicrobia bacterium GWC2_63_65]